MMIDKLDPEFVEFMPKELRSDKLYISIRFRTTSHLCACGCGNRVVLPLSPAEWKLYYDGETVSICPSVGNWEFPCRSHYWIRKNKIVWAKPMDQDQIDRRRGRDADELDAYFAERTSIAEPSRTRPAARTWSARLLTWLGLGGR